MTTMQTKMYARDIRHKIAEIKPGGYTGLLDSDLNEMLIEQVERITTEVWADALAVRDGQIERLASVLADITQGTNSGMTDDGLGAVYLQTYVAHRNKGFDQARVKAFKAMIETALRVE